MNNQVSDQDPLLLQLKQLITDKFPPRESSAGPITADEPLINGRLGLDSLDALELGLSVEEKFGVTIASAAESRSAFASLASLAAFIHRHAPPRAIASPVASRVSPHRWPAQSHV